jgi:hypothetical protein
LIDIKSVILSEASRGLIARGAVEGPAVAVVLAVAAPRNDPNRISTEIFQKCGAIFVAAKRAFSHRVYRAFHRNFTVKIPRSAHLFSKTPLKKTPKNSKIPSVTAANIFS